MLKTRIKTGVALAFFGILLIFFVGPVFPYLWWIIFSVIMWEWAAMPGLNRTKKMVYLIAFIFLSAFAFMIPLSVLKMGVLFWIAAGISLFFSRESLKFLVSQSGYFLTGLFLLVPAWVAGIQLYLVSSWMLLYVILVIAASDIGAYFAGKKWGKHFLAPKISPKKTWEGAFGGLVSGVILGVIFAFLGNKLLPEGMGMPKAEWIFLSVALVIFGIIGDLFESQIKRLLGVKDSGKLLPGHGGFLDRFDSHFAGLVIAAFVIAWL
jgi:phosphatidate cytidylyltransferase